MLEFNGEARKFGRKVALGFLDVVCLVLVFMFIASFVLMALMPIDNSDFGRFDRSGFRILTDAKTGQEYLVTSDGGIVERKSVD